MENVDIAEYLILKRGVNRGSAIVGRSTQKQRIERLWRDVYEGVLGLYYRLFYFMEDEGILDPLNEIHLAALHYIYLPLINEKLNSGVGHGHATGCALQDPHRSVCGYPVSYKIHWALNFGGISQTIMG